MISVVIPCFNSAEYVGRAIESVLKQTYTQYEIILVDNGSSDNTLDVLYSYRDKYPDCIRVFRELKKGSPAARNKGLSESVGEWVQFLDSDDELMPEKFKEQIKVAKEQNADLVFSTFYKYYYIKGVQKRIVQAFESSDIWKGLILSRLGRTSSTLWRKEPLLKVNGWDEDKTSSQEYNLIFKLLKQNASFVLYPVPLTNIYIQGSSISKSVNQKRRIEILNNYIGLRLNIKEYLKSQDKLTKDLDEAVSSSIYENIMVCKEVIPEYVSQKLNELKLGLPVSYYIKRYLRQTKNYLRNYKVK